MKKILSIVVLFVFSAALWGQERLMVSDNPQFNEIVKKFSGYPSSPTGKYLSVQIEKANAVNGVYRNVVRLWYGKGNADYINLVYNTFPTESEAKAALKSEIKNGGSIVYIDWDAMIKSSITIDLSHASFKEVTNKGIANSKSVKRMAGKKPEVKTEEKSFDLSFDGLELDQQRGWKGRDGETGFNANYYSRDKRIVTLQGTEGKSWAELAKAPRRKGDALHFTAAVANDRDIAGDKLRVTGSVSGLNATEIVNSVDIYIPCSWKSLTKIESGITWLTIQEYWCASAGIPVDGEPQFRMTLGVLKKPGKGNKLYFDLKAQDLETTLQADGSWKEKYTTLYELDDRESKRFEIPFGKWFNLRTEIVAGDSENGHFRLVATDQKGRETVIFDEVCQTAASGYFKPGAKQPLYKSVSPLKLYTSAKMLQYMKGKPLDIYYDNWKYKAVCISEE